MIEITEAIAKKVVDAVDAGLVAGVGIQEPGKMCVEAAVCYRAWPATRRRSEVRLAGAALAEDSAE